MDIYKGRINRRTYVTGLGILLISFLIAGIIGQLINHFLPTTGNYFPWVWYFPAVIFGFSLYVRRLHDLGKSGWFSLLYFVPLVNIVLGICMLFIPGKRKNNIYGKPPSEKQGFQFAVFLHGKLCLMIFAWTIILFVMFTLLFVTLSHVFPQPKSQYVPATTFSQ